MKQINLSETMIRKAKQRLETSPYAKQFSFGSKHPSGYTIRGLFKSEKELILEDNNGRYYLVPCQGTNPNLTQTTQVEKKPVKIELVKISDLNYDDRIFIPMKTNQPIDYMFSSEGGIYPATNYMVIGDPGIGKSTQTLDILAQITKADPTKKVLFISGEMNQIDMYGYVKRYPAFGQIPTLFLCDYIDENPKEVMEQTFKQGWDLILIDSFIEVQESVQSACNMTRTYAEKWMIDLMVHNNKGHNDGKRFTSFLAIQQVTKGGNFVGSNKLKHNTTGMIELRYSSEFSGDRYAKVTKNRRGFKYEKIYFSLDKTEYVEYDQKRIDRDLEIQQRLNKEKEMLLSEEEKFNQIFGISKTNELEIAE
jgi:predicted ATP-dependent serine protease